MVSMMLMTLWGALDFFLLAAGGIMIAFSILWKAPDAFRNLVLTEMDLTGALRCLPRLQPLVR
jgi:drug/metabolite transporter superfamily protein YnfA